MRFYVSSDSIFPERKIIEIRDKKELHHILDVMRLKKGIGVSVFDGKGKEWTGTIKAIRKDLVLIDIEKCIDVVSHRPFKVTLYQAIPKKSKMDFIVEKAVELGVDKICPIITERTEAVPGKAKAHIKVERWRRIGISASKQCGRRNLPLISDITDFDNALLDSKKMDLNIFSALDRAAKPLKEILKGYHEILQPFGLQDEPSGKNKKKNSQRAHIAVFVGPEGDFSQDEIKTAKEQGYSICSLGSLVLRVETAGIYVLSCLNYEYTL